MLTKREQYVMRKFRAMLAAFKGFEFSDEYAELMPQAVHDWKMHVARWGFEAEGNGCFSVVVSHRFMPGKVIKHNPTNADGSFSFCLHLTVLRHPRLPVYYHVEGDLDGYTAVAEALSANAGWQQHGLSDDDPEGYKQALDLIHAMGYTMNDLHDENIMMRGDDINAWVINDPANGSNNYHKDTL